MASARLVVTKARGGTKITLVGASGTELLSSKVFVEPRGKGATMRSLRSLLGDDVLVDDQTVVDSIVAGPSSGSRGSSAVRRPATAKANGTTTRRRRSL